LGSQDEFVAGKKSEISRKENATAYAGREKAYYGEEKITSTC